MLSEKQKSYICVHHKRDVDWLNNNQASVIKAITEPLYVDKLPRYSGKYVAKIAHVIHTGEKENPYLNVVLSFHRGGKYPAQIWTAFRASSDYLFTYGKLNERWLTNIK